MKKNPIVWLSLCLILAYTTASGVTFENGCLSGYWYFHLECDNDAKTCELSQRETISPTTEDYQCWYNNSTTDLVTALNTDKTSYTLSVTSSLDLGGYDESTGLCTMDFSPITANYVSVDGKTNTIDGFCYVTTGDVGFFKNRSNEVKDITFKNAYVKGTGKVGVLANSIGSATLTNITIDGATVVGDNAGGVAGNASYFDWTNSVINNVDVSGSIVGGAFGTVNFSGSNGWIARYDTLSGNSVIKGSTIAGGFIGSATISASRLYFYLEYSTIDADVLVENTDASYNGNVVAGGLIGNLKTSSNYYNYVYLRYNILKGNVKILTNDVTGNVYVGGLVGNAENSGYDSPYLNSRELTNSMNVEANLGSVEGNVAVGGAVGNALNYSTYYGLKMELNDCFQNGSVKLETDNVKGNVAIGGVFGNFEAGAEFEKSKFDGLVSFSTNQFDSQSFLYMGSIWGNANKASLEVQNSCSFGNISYSGVDASQANVGYFGGFSNESESNRRVRNNYHYGQDDIMVGIGNYTATAWGEGATTEGNCSNCLYIENNVRNSIKDAEIDHEATHRNQIYSEAEMKTDALAYKLGYDPYEGNKTWSRKDDVLDGLPFFVSGEYLPIKKIGFAVSSFSQDVVSKIKAKGYDFSSAGDTVYIYSNCHGNLNKSDVDFLNGLLDDTHYWSGPIAVSTSSLFIGNAYYEYQSVETWYIAYHFCIGDVQNGDLEYEIWPDFSPVSGYDMDFIFTPVVEFEMADYSKMVPPLYVSDATETKFLKVSWARVNSRTAGENPIEWMASRDSTFSHDQRAYDLVRYLKSSALSGANIEDYSDTLHVFYEFGQYPNDNTFELAVNPINGVLPSVKVNSFIYDISDGSWGKLTNSETVSARTGTIPVATGFTIDIDNVPVGYSKDNYSLIFNYSYVNATPDTIISDDNYLVRPADFMLNDGYRKHVWVKEDLTPNDTIRLDSVYKALGRASAGLYDMQMTVVPSPTNFNISFDIGNGQYFVLGHNWVTKKENANVLTNSELPKLYLKSGGGANPATYMAMEWSPIKNATPNDPYAGVLTVDLLTGSGTDLTLFPYAPGRSDAAAIIRVEANDGAGNAMTEQEDYHGTISLKQKISDAEDADSLKQESIECAIGEHYVGNLRVYEYNHCLYVPKVDDTLSFKVSISSEDGYAVTLIEPSFKWRDSNANESDPPAGFGYNDADSTLVINPEYMSTTTEGMNFKVKYTITGPFYVTYDLNTPATSLTNLYFPVDATPAEKLEFDDNVTSVALWQPFRTDMCFEGWSVDDPSIATDKIKTLFATYAIPHLSMKPDAPTKLYANWSVCASTPSTKVTVANGNTNASLKLKQTYDGQVYEHNLENQAIILDDNTYQFEIDTVNSDVIFGYDKGDFAASSSVTDRVGDVSEPTAMTLTGLTVEVAPLMLKDQKASPNTIYTLNLKTSATLFNFAFDVNTTDTVFYGVDWTNEVDGISVESNNNQFPQYIAQLGKCFEGWSTAKDDADGYTSLTDNGFMLKLAQAIPEVVASKQVYKLYAIWNDACTGRSPPATYDLVTDVEKEKGFFRIYQMVDGNEVFVRTVAQGDKIEQLKDDYYEFYVEFVPSAIYYMTASFEMTVAYMGASATPLATETIQNPYAFNTLANMTNGASAVTLSASGLQLDIFQLALTFELDVNADTVFYGTSFNDFEVHAQKDEPITTDVYRVGYKLKGWSFSAPQKSSETSQQPTQHTVVAYVPGTHLKFDTDFEGDYARYLNTFGHGPDTLYAVWEKDDNSSVRYVVNKDPNVNAFTFKLSQEVQGTPFHYFVTDSLAVPAVDGIEFNMELLYDPDDFDIDSKRAIVVLNEKDEQLGILENSSWLSLSESVGLRANILKDKRVRLDLDENTKDTLFHGSDWIDKIDFDQDSVKSVELPTLAYNAEKCLAGWTTDTTSDKLFTVVNDDLLTELRAQSKSQNVDISALLHAKWTTNPDSCAGQFVQLAVEQDNGTIWFAEKDKDNTIERRFTDKGTMFVPMELKGDNLKVQASGADTSVYVLDSLVVLRFGDRDTVLHEGDYMPEVLDNVTLKAYFGWKNKTEVAFKNVRLDSNGVAFRLNFKASDFEVRRNVSAHLRVIDKVRKRPPVVDVTLGDSIAMGFETKDFNFRMDKPGKYRMELTLKGKADSVVTDSIDFSVSAAIPAIAADTWQMISLSAVDLSAIKNDGDRIFYWWDERGTGEFWQYKKLNLKDSIDPTRGVWYNSREGRALPLLDEFDTKDDDFTWELENVNTGWNMVANPYNWTLDLYAKKPGDRKNMGDDSEISFWSYDADAGEPVPTDTIRPYESVWAYVPKKSAEWKMSAAPFFPPEAVALEKSALAKASTKDRWTLQAKLADMNGKRDSWNILGAGLNPVTAEQPPESMGDHVNLTIVEGKRALAKSIKAASDEMEWKIALSASSDRIGYLSFAGIDGVNAYGYRVFVTVDGNTTEMREGEPLKVYLKSSAKMATVRVAPAAKAVAKNTLKGLRTARLGNRLQVTFDASGLAGTNARVDIVDLKGNVKSTAAAKTIEGSNALVLDAPQSGLYMLRVRAGSQQQAVKILVR